MVIHWHNLKKVPFNEEWAKKGIQDWKVTHEEMNSNRLKKLPKGLVINTKRIYYIGSCQWKRGSGIGAYAVEPTIPIPIRRIEEIGYRVVAG